MRGQTDSFVLSGTSAKYCNTFELAWKLMKDVLIEYYGVTDFLAGSPRETLRTAFRMKIINDDSWMDMLKLSNLLAHDYNLATVTEAFDQITQKYLPLFEKFRDTIQKLL